MGGGKPSFYINFLPVPFGPFGFAKYNELVKFAWPSVRLVYLTGNYIVTWQNGTPERISLRKMPKNPYFEESRKL